MAPTPTAHASASAASAGKHAPQPPHNRRLNPKSLHRPKHRRPLKSEARSSHAAAAAAANPGDAKSKPMSRAGRAAAAKVSRPCGECGQRFWSERALFGHMRWHSDRRRGVEPRRGRLPRKLPKPGRPPGEENAIDAEAMKGAACLVLMSCQAARGFKKPKWKKGDLHGLVVLMGAAVAASAAASSAPRARGCGFDLNLPPPEEPQACSDSFRVMDRKQLPPDHGFV